MTAFFAISGGEQCAQASATTGTDANSATIFVEEKEKEPRRKYQEMLRLSKELQEYRDTTKLLFETLVAKAEHVRLTRDLVSLSRSTGPTTTSEVWSGREAYVVCVCL